MTRRPRYDLYARWYDRFSGEPVYRAGREAALRLLAPRPGDRALALGCGTGLDLPGLVAATGHDGAVVGVDRNAAMLAVAAGKARDRGWDRVHLVRADAERLTGADLAGVPDAAGAPFDVLLVTYLLSLLDDPAAAWAAARALLAPGARVGVVDLALPDGRARWAAPLARLACRAGGADPHARAWEVVEADLVGVRTRRLRGGHVHVVVGTWPGGPPAA